jgi:hypothetical protein
MGYFEPESITQMEHSLEFCRASGCKPDLQPTFARDLIKNRIYEELEVQEFFIYEKFP